jgi:hypothetical protein
MLRGSLKGKGGASLTASRRENRRVIRGAIVTVVIIDGYVINIRMKKLDLERSNYYSVAVQKALPSANPKQKGLPTMKLTLRIFALSIVFVGVAAASVSHSSARALPSHQSATAANPVPLCGPGIPCGPTEK